MTNYALDTNVVSEPTKDIQNPRVISFLREHTAAVWLPSVVVHELEYGIQLLPQGRRRNRLRAMVEGIVSSFSNRILPLERSGSEWAALYRAQARRDGRLLRLSDALIAGIAKANDLAVATRNVRDFTDWISKSSTLGKQRRVWRSASPVAGGARPGEDRVQHIEG